MNKHSRSFNVLIEMLICVCFFTAICFVCVNAIVKSYKLNDKANHLQKAVLHSDKLANTLNGYQHEGLNNYLHCQGDENNCEYDFEDMLVKVMIIDHEESDNHFKYDFNISIYYHDELMNELNVSKIGEKYE